MKQKKSILEMMFDGGNTFFMILFTLSILYPFWAQIITSLSSLKAGSSLEFTLWPEQLSLRAYKMSLNNPLLVRAYANTIFRTVVGTLGTTLFSSAMAYGLSKRYLVGRNIWTLLLIITMFFGGGLIPTYMLIRALGLLNTLAVYVVPGLVAVSQVFLTRNYMMSLPEAMEESAKIDGANDIYIWAFMVIPASMPILATCSLWNAVGHWNAWYDSLLYNTDKNLMVVAYYLQKVLRDNVPTLGMSPTDIMEMMKRQKDNMDPESLKSAVLMVTVIPIIFVYPFLQRYFIKGIMIGSLKG